MHTDLQQQVPGSMFWPRPRCPSATTPPTPRSPSLLMEGRDQCRGRPSAGGASAWSLSPSLTTQSAELCTLAQALSEAGDGPGVVPPSLQRWVTNEQTGPFRGVKHPIKEVKAGVCEGQLLGSVDSFQEGAGRSSWRRCHLR